MQKFKAFAMSRQTVLIACLVLVLVVGVDWSLTSRAQIPVSPTGVKDKSDKAKAPDSHAQAKGKQDPGDQNLASQLVELRAKMAQLEAAQKNSQASGIMGIGGGGGMMGMGGVGGGMGGVGGGMGGGMYGVGMYGVAGGTGFMGVGGGMGGVGGGMGGMGGGMGGMMGMTGGLGGFGGVSGSAEAAEMIEMIGVMGTAPKSASSMSGMKSMGKMQMQSAMPSILGASHIYHVGATDFFLNHPQHIKLTAKQKASLSRIKENAVLAKTTAQRKIDEAEQELWTLTSADEPNLAKLEVKVQEIEKLRGAQRLALIRAVGDAARLLTAEKRQALLGTEADKKGKRDPYAGHRP